MSKYLLILMLFSVSSCGFLTKLKNQIFGETSAENTQTEVIDDELGTLTVDENGEEHLHFKQDGKPAAEVTPKAKLLSLIDAYYQSKNPTFLMDIRRELALSKSYWGELRDPEVVQGLEKLQSLIESEHEEVIELILVWIENLKGENRHLAIKALATGFDSMPEKMFARKQLLQDECALSLETPAHIQTKETKLEYLKIRRDRLQDAESEHRVPKEEHGSLQTCLGRVGKYLRNLGGEEGTFQDAPASTQTTVAPTPVPTTAAPPSAKAPASVPVVTPTAVPKAVPTVSAPPPAVPIIPAAGAVKK